MRLVIVQGPGQGTTYDLVDGELVAGREASREIHLPSARVSRKHCSFTVTGDRCIVRDLGSANGLVVNGHRMEACELVDGTQLQVGDIVLLFQSGPAVAPPASEPPPTATAAPAAPFGGDPPPFGGEAPPFGGPAEPVPFGGDPAPFGAPVEPAPFGGGGGFGAAPPQPEATPAQPPQPTAAPQQGPSALERLPFTVRLAALLVAAGLIVLCGPLGGLVSLATGGATKVQEMAVEKGWALASGLGHRNSTALATRQALEANADIYNDDPFVKTAWVSDTTGKVVAPPEKVNRKLNTGTKTQELWKLAEREGRGVVEVTEEGWYAYMVPIKGTGPGSKTANLKVGYAYLVYDADGAADEVGKPTWRLLFGFFWLAVSAVVTLVGVRRLAAAPLLVVRDETELAMKGDAGQVEAPTKCGC